MLYLDNAATTKVAKEVLDSMNPFFESKYGNPSSIHTMGQNARRYVEEARKQIANFINCESSEIIFTASGSEANNLAIKGFAFSNKCEIITTGIEHKSVLESCKFLYKHAIINELWKVKVFECGSVDIKNLESICKTVVENKNIPFVSIQFANSEIGTIQFIKEISEIVHKYNGILHVDAVQAFGCVPINVKDLGIDMMSVSGHKIHAPKGIGFLYKKKDINIEPLINGGHQEWGLRAGTENVPYIIGLAKAVEIVQNAKWKRVKSMRNYLIMELIEKIPEARVNGSLINRLPGNINVSFRDIDGEALLLLLNLKSMYVSNGSACNSGSLESSYVLKEIGVPENYINGTIRITIDDSIQWDDIDHIVAEIKKAIDIMKLAKGE